MTYPSIRPISRADITHSAMKVGEKKNALKVSQDKVSEIKYFIKANKIWAAAPIGKPFIRINCHFPLSW